MDFMTIALISTNIALFAEAVSNYRFRRKVAKLLGLQAKVNATQLEINRNLIGIKEEN